MNIAIVDDENECIESLKSHIGRFFGENPLGGGTTETSVCIDVFRDGDELIKDYKPKYDIIFMDIEMERVNGMKAARVIRETDEVTALIFVTRLARYAVRSYDVSALDFIVKPIDYYGFALKMKKAVRYCNSVRKNPIVIKCDAGMISLTERQIYYIEVLEHNVIYHTDKGDFSMFGSLKTEAERLGSDFVFCNRCYIINLRHVEAVTDNIVTVHGKELVISRYKKKDFMEALVAYWSKRG